MLSNGCLKRKEKYKHNILIKKRKILNYCADSLIKNMAADPPDAGMDTCPSPEIGDSRKRPLDSDTENGSTKRSHFSSGKCNAISFISIQNYFSLHHFSYVPTFIYVLNIIYYKYIQIHEIIPNIIIITFQPHNVTLRNWVTRTIFFLFR